MKSTSQQAAATTLAPCVSKEKRVQPSRRHRPAGPCRDTINLCETAASRARCLCALGPRYKNWDVVDGQTDKGMSCLVPVDLCKCSLHSLLPSAHAAPVLHPRLPVYALCPVPMPDAPCCMPYTSGCISSDAKGRRRNPQIPHDSGSHGNVHP